MFELIDIVLIVIAVESIITFTKYLGKNGHIHYTKSVAMLSVFVFLVWSVMIFGKAVIGGDFKIKDWFDVMFFVSCAVNIVVCGIVVAVIRKYASRVK